MAKYKVLRAFRDIHTNDVYKQNSVIELTDERAAEVNENLKEKGTFIELIVEEPKGDEFDREAAKEKLKELGVEFKGNASNETLKQLLDEHEGDE
ncbi:hypothetical protein ACFFF5_21060 [Lederbergia wuyishanensis]|uniref:Phage protein n=1 Tax=Lederbergia wuyishanensis TaxID=1347903 RepID=A0ABU0D778_9BACI|nr:hypothetical protein [Lederbergia wuyishanensis]MCJ8008907.1 hypothetical protein [Lederbergia wuyishanensis]MDQ0344232.1 hypothetical protein [Lederbergia wuyishanensis]